MSDDQVNGIVEGNLEKSLGKALAPPTHFGETPPLSLLPSITAAVDEACRAIPADKHFALVFLAQQDGQGAPTARAAVVTRIGDDFKLAGWIGKDWSLPGVSWGVQGVWTP